MKRFEKRGAPLLQIAIGLGIAAVFWGDYNVPLGVVVWIFYLAPLMLTLFGWRPRTPLIVAAVCSLAIIAGYWHSQGTSGFHGIARLNRTFGVLILWAVAVAARQFIWNRLQVEERDWITSGQRDLSARMQGQPNLRSLGEGVLPFLCRYLEALVGTLYVAQQDGSCRRVAAFALAADETSREVIAPGEGLLGQAARDQHLIVVEDVPREHCRISSALGRSRPRHLIVLPAVVEKTTRAVLELGFLHPVGRAERDLLESVAEPIAVAVRSAEYRTRLEELLEETQRQAEALQTQQQELRATNEELEEQSRAVHESHARLEAQQAELEQTNTQLQGQTQELEAQRDDLAGAQRELTAKAEELARANQFKSEFLANMSHELRTPLNSSLILAKLLVENKEGNLTPEQIRYAETIYAAGNDLLALINDILDLSRIEAGRLQLQVEPVVVGRTVEALVRAFQPVAREKHLEFTTAIDPGVPRAIETDAMRLQQILNNLLSNAFKFTRQGTVTLRVSPLDGGRIAFAVHDTGIGIPGDKHQVIFEAFRQADGSTQRQYGGTGLGLSISRDLARRLGGDVVLESAPGSGSTFTLVLPRRPPPSIAWTTEPPPAFVEPPGPTAPLPGRADASAVDTEPADPRTGIVAAVDDDRATLAPGARSILVIEDDVPFARILYDLARERQFRCLIATTAAEGLELARRYQPSAIVLDIHLPDESGLALLDRFKGCGALRHIPVHVVSVSDCTRQALELGAVGYALKPVQREELVRAFENLQQRIDQKIRRVLVVEDVETQRESLRQLLGGADVEITAVGTASEALGQLREATFDCMVMDLGLPDMSGYQLLDEMAKDEVFSFPPVIVYTARSLDEDEEQRLRRFSHSIVIKGACSPERLLDEVTLFLHRVESTLPYEQQRMLRAARNRDSVFEGRRILLAEDDVRNIFALTSVLEPKGAKLEIARNGREALDLLFRAAETEAAGPGPGPGIDLVLMDIMMPEMDGLTAMREIRKRAEWARLPIIALTAKAMTDDRDKCLEAGANDYIAKPLDVDKLLSLMRVWMPK